MFISIILSWETRRGTSLQRVWRETKIAEHLFSPIQLIFFFNSISLFLPFPVGAGEAEVAGGGAAVRTGEHPDAGFEGIGCVVVRVRAVLKH